MSSNKRKSTNVQKDAQESASAPKAKRARKSKSKAQGDLDTLGTLAARATEEGLTSQNTNKTYRTYVAAGKEFVKELVAKKRAAQAAGTPEMATQVPGNNENLDLNLLEKAFENPPNRLSALALEYLMVDKCVWSTCKPGTGISIYSAFKNYWEHM